MDRDIYNGGIPDGIHLRRMLVSDSDEYLAFESRVFGAHPDVEMYKKACMRKENVYMAAESENGMAAYCTIVTSFETADLYNIAVKEEYRRKGIARKLLSECLRQCQGMGVNGIFLEVRESNIPALNFYDKMGFIKIGKRKGYYSNPSEDAVIMKKTL